MHELRWRVTDLASKGKLRRQGDGGDEGGTGFLVDGQALSLSAGACNHSGLAGPPGVRERKGKPAESNMDGLKDN